MDRRKICTTKFEKPPSFTVIGIGNEFREDDGVGPYIINLLNSNGRLPGNVSLHIKPGEPLSLLNCWARKDAGIILDSIHRGISPGKIYRFEVHDSPLPAEYLNISTHSFGIHETIEIAREMNQLPQYLIFYGIEGRTFNYGIGLSAEVKKSADSVALELLREIHLLYRAI